MDGTLGKVPVGKNSISEYLKKMAKLLDLPDAKKYSVHFWRRTGATLLANKGISVENLLRFGRWKNLTTAQVYILESKKNKIDIAELFNIPPSSEDITLSSNTSSSSDAKKRAKKKRYIKVMKRKKKIYHTIQMRINKDIKFKPSLQTWP